MYNPRDQFAELITRMVPVPVSVEPVGRVSVESVGRVL